MAEFSAEWRRWLLARLAAERAHLFFQMRGLGGETLTGVPVSGKMTARDVLLHVANWDAVNSERLSLTLDGRHREILPVANVDEANEELHGRFQSIPLEQAVAASLKERSGFLAALDRLPDDLLHRRLALSGGRRIHPRTWARWRFQHDAAHAQDILAWRQTQPRDALRQIGPKFLLRAQLKATRREILSLVAVVPPDERIQRPVCGVWTLKDLLGHLTDWEKVGVEGLRQLVDEQTPEFAQTITDFDVFNAANAAARMDQSWEAVWADFTATRQSLLALVDELPEPALARPFQAPWGSTVSAYTWLLVWMGHDHEHAIDVRHALGVSGWPNYLTRHGR
ncbi:MAG: DinB family protein [Chloroflexi bacterium]|nr:DinB family protein [Chloroflexota bacterium]